MINLRKLMTPKLESSFIDVDLKYMSSIQLKMLNFIKNNPRSIITAPRQIGKTLFLIMAAAVSNNNVCIISLHNNINKFIFEMAKKCYSDNNIEFTFNTNAKIIMIDDKKIVFKSRYNDLSNYDNYDIYVDECYMFPDLGKLPIKDADTCVMVGTPNSNNFNYNNIGLFAGLNINGDS